MSRRACIDLVSPPFAGHLHPLLGAALALAESHDVRVLGTRAARSRVVATGLPFVELCPCADAELERIADPGRASGANPFHLAGQFRRALRLLAAFDAALEALYQDARPDLLLADFTVPVAGAVAARHGIPWWTLHPSPCVIEGAGGPPAYLGWQPGRGPLGRARDVLATLAVRGFKRCVHALHRRELAALGFPSLYRADGSEAAYSPERILALGLRALEFERAWPPQVDFVGPVLWSPPGVGPEPPVNAPRAVLATLGTHLGWSKAPLASELERYARAHPGLAIHFSAGAFAGELASPDGALRRHPWVDYARWIPRMAAVVHHGGTGVMYACLRAGVPAVVWPRDYDQADHAARLVAARVALRVRRLQELGPALNRVLGAAAGLEPARFVEELRPGRSEARIVDAVRARLGT